MAAVSNNKKTTTTSRTTTTGKGKAGGPKKQTGKAGSKKSLQAEDSFIRAEIVIICSFAVCLLFFLSNFKLCGSFGGFLRSIQLGLFGMIGYLAPVLIFAGICFRLSNRGNIQATLKLAAVTILLFTLCGFAQLMFGQAYTDGQKLFDIYAASSKDGVGGGLFGGLLSILLSSTVGSVGSYLVLCVLLIICIVCITEKSLVSVVKLGSDKAYQYAREDMDRRRELHAEQKEEKKRLREEQRVRGVDLDSTKLEEMNLEPEENYVLEADMEDELAAQVAAAALDEPRRRADVFSGSIAVPSYNEDSVPFDEEIDLEELSRKLTEVGIRETSQSQEIFVQKDTRTMKELDVVGAGRPTPEEAFNPPIDEGINYDSFFIPEEQKTVVTANGKIIETDTEMLQKKLENKRQDVKEAKTEKKEAGDLSVGELIKEKETFVKKEYIFPSVALLKKGTRSGQNFSDKEYKETAIKLQQTLQNFGVGVTVTNISCGPSVTRYELLPEQGVKVSKIVSLTDDIKLSLAAADVRIEAPIPGKSAVGIEVPNKENNMVYYRDLLESDEFKNHKSSLAFAVGKDIGGQVVVADIAKMPHLLIAGATGSGKSVCINTLIMSIIYKSSPDDVKMIMIDPKVVELSVYNGIPHLLIPVVTDPKKASGALNWAVAEMMDRYDKFAKYNVRDLKGYNAKIEAVEKEVGPTITVDGQRVEEETKLVKLPQIVIIVDELADLMMVAPGEVEDAICRLAQLARAAGIHLVIATQRPSVNVITGLIKANVPSRIAFSVSSGVDSRTIIDMNGAEKLLGKGDMLFYPSGYQKPQRVQGAFISDSEVSKVVDFLTQQEMVTEYNPDIESRIVAPAASEAGGAGSDSGRDSYFGQAGKFIIEKDKASIGMLQRVFKIGFNRAARIMDQLAEAGVVGEEEGTKPRKVLMTMEEFEEFTA